MHTRTQHPGGLDAGNDDTRALHPAATTDWQDELFEVLDSDGNPTGVVKRRADVHRDGDWHAAVHIWVGGVAPDGTPFTLLQRRSLTKDTFPGVLDVAVGGHRRAGETLAESLRESEEEIGLQVDPETILQIGRRFVSVQLPPPNVPEQELQEVFAVRSDADLSGYRLHPEELSGLVRVRIDAFESLLRWEVADVPAEEWRLGSGSGSGSGDTTASTIPFQMTLADFPYARRTNVYPLQALASLRRLLAGDPPEEPWVIREVLT